MASTPPVPADSATVILLRDGTAGSCEVLLVERHAQSRAFAGASVFPGGIVEGADAGAALGAASGLAAGDAQLRLREDLTADAALAIWIAAVRELFEETGVLLARRGDDGTAALFPAVLRRHRFALLAGELTFADFVARENLVLCTDELRYFSRWITPVQAPRRYDARFFVARVPDGQEPLHDDRETTATLWITPAQAIARAHAGTLTFAPPTLRTLHDLHDLGTSDAIYEAAERRGLAPILPRMTSVDGNPAVLYPDDVDYDRIADGGTALSTAEMASGPYDRMVLADGAWRSVRTRPT